MTECSCATEQSSEYSKDQEEISDLRAKLEQAESRNTELSERLKVQATLTEQVVFEWKLKLEASNTMVAEQAREKDEQLSEISADLLHFEGCLLRNREKTNAALAKKEERIGELQRKLKHQQKQINALNYANERLLNSLHGSRENSEDSNEKRDSVSGYDSDDTLCDAETSGESEEVQYEAVSIYEVNGSAVGHDKGSRSVNDSSNWENSAFHENHRNSPHGDRPRCERPSDHVNDDVGNNVDYHVSAHMGKRVSYRSVRRRKYSDVTNGRYRPSSSSSSGRSQRTDNEPKANGTAPKTRDHRVRFWPDVNKIQEEPDEGGVFDKVKTEVKVRKYSLPAYRLPIVDDDGDEEFI